MTMGMDKLNVLDKAKKDSDVMTQFVNVLEGHSLCIVNVLDKWAVHWEEFFEKVSSTVRSA